MLLNLDIDQVETAVRKEMEGPGKLLGYRTFQVHELNVPRDLVYAVTCRSSC